MDDTILIKMKFIFYLTRSCPGSFWRPSRTEQLNRTEQAVYTY